jgi:TolB-like protein
MMRKKTITLSLAALMLFIGPSVFAQNIIALDQAISYSASEIESRLEPGVRVAVLNFKSPSERLSNYVLEEMATMLTRNGKVTVVERSNLEFILWELRYERSGDINDEAARTIGRILGAQYVVSGVIEEVSTNYVVQFKTIPVEPSALQTFTRVGVVKDTQIANLMGADTFNALGYISNAKKNWISGELGFMGGGIRYERMVSANFSFGVNAYLNFLLFLFGAEIGADASFRFYPWGKTFFIGTGVGFHVHSLFDTEAIGVAVTPEIGWKIDVGNEGEFYLQPGVKYPFTFGPKSDFDTSSNFGISFGFGVPYFGMGYAF